MKKVSEEDRPGLPDASGWSSSLSRPLRWTGRQPAPQWIARPAAARLPRWPDLVHRTAARRGGGRRARPADRRARRGPRHR